MSTIARIPFRHAVLSALLLSTAGCGGPENSPPASGPPASASAPAPASATAPKYAATLAEGIAFSRPGVPEFVASLEGFSVPEPFGRWTDAPRATITFTAPLPQKFTLELAGVQRTTTPIGIVIGGKRQDVTFAQPWTFSTVTLPIETDGTATSITLEIGAVESPKAKGEADDGRLLGVALASLKVTS